MDAARSAEEELLARLWYLSQYSPGLIAKTIPRSHWEEGCPC